MTKKSFLKRFENNPNHEYVLDEEGNLQSREIAKKLIDAYCKTANFKNRGPKPDTSTLHKRLGFIRDTFCWATLIELGFIDNKNDLIKLLDYDKIAEGVLAGIQAIYGDDIVSKLNWIQKLLHDIQIKLELLKRK